MILSGCEIGLNPDPTTILTNKMLGYGRIIDECEGLNGLDKRAYNLIIKRNIKQTKMSEAKSRYGIMQELSERKVREREQLNKLETEKAKVEYEAETKREALADQITLEESTYMRTHKTNIKELTVRKTMLEADMKRKVEALQDNINKANNTYESDFQEWKAKIKADIKTSEDGTKVYAKNMKAKIKNQNSILDEIDNSIKSLKEISKDQKE